MSTVYGAVRFVASKAGKTGLTVAGMVDVYQITKSTGASSQVVTDGLAIEIGQGLYGYAYGSADTALYAYLAVFTTADTTVDDTQPAVWMADMAEQAALTVVDGIVDAIKAKTDNIGAAAVTVTTPVASSSSITLYKGDDYDADQSRQLVFSDSGGTWPDLTGATIKLFITSVLPLGKAGTLYLPGTSTQRVEFELTAAEISASGVYSFAVVATLAVTNRIITLTIGTCRISDRAPNT